MSTPADLEQALADYLQVRRASGAGLARAEKLLRQYLSHLSEHGTDRITVADGRGQRCRLPRIRGGGRIDCLWQGVSPPGCTLSTSRCRCRRRG